MGAGVDGCGRPGRVQCGEGVWGRIHVVWARFVWPGVGPQVPLHRKYQSVKGTRARRKPLASCLGESLKLWRSKRKLAGSYQEPSSQPMGLGRSGRGPQRGLGRDWEGPLDLGSAFLRGT